MQLVSSLWPFVVALVVVAGSALTLVSAITYRDVRAPVSRLGAVFVALVWARLAGVAAFGDQRPAFERQWNGVAALLLALAGAVHLAKSSRRRGRETPAPPSREVTPATRSAVDLGRAVLVTMPALGEHAGQGTVTRWLKKVGERVEAGEPLVEVSADKVEVEIPADVSGALREINVAAGGTTPVGTTIAVIEVS